jgi:large subunit ribosomal protein L22
MAAVADSRASGQAVTVQAVAKFVRISPRKARLVTDNIRGRSVPEARTILAFTERAAAVEIEKVLSSAVANAESNPALQWRGDTLVVAAVYVDEGPTIKRWRARARGRVARIKKRTCHITIQVAQTAAAAPVEQAPAKSRRRALRGATEKRATENAATGKKESQ